MTILFLVALCMLGCKESCDFDAENPPIEIKSPDGKHVVRFGGGACWGFRVELVSRVQIKDISEDWTNATEVFDGDMIPKVEWIDSDHLSIIITKTYTPFNSLRQAKGVVIMYHLDPGLTETKIRQQFKSWLDAGLSVQVNGRGSEEYVAAQHSFWQKRYEDFIRWAKEYTGYQASVDRPIWEP